jgi:hypothetical protein
MKKFKVTIYAEPQVIEVEAEDELAAEHLAWDMHTESDYISSGCEAEEVEP